MNYDYESCFWDPHDDGVNVLLKHIQSGIKSCGTIEQFFKQRAELEKDYARRLGAINEKLNKDLSSNPEYGHLNNAFQTLLDVEKAKAHAHSKQSELIYRQAFSNTKLFGGELQARYTTISGKIEKLRLDKFNKRKGCEELSKRLDKASIRARDLRLNQNNIIGSKRVEQNEKELAKWENNFQETKLQLNVLKQEYKGSQKFWLHEWGDITHLLQEMEQARIQFMQAKLQVYIDASTETSILEQSKLDLLNNKLTIFTAFDDITSFSSEYGTGRLKERHRSKNTLNQTPDRNEIRDFSTSKTSREDNSADYRSSRVSYNHTMNDPYLDNIKILFSKLQQNSQNRRSLSMNKKDNTSSDKTNPHSSSDTTINADDRSKVEQSSSSELGSKEQYGTLMKNSENRPITPPPEPIETESIDHLKIENHIHQNTSSTSYTTSDTSSNPTDFTTHIKKRESLDSMTTSVSSMASGIEETQRFSKSWNSSSRKRKSMNHINQILSYDKEIGDEPRQVSTNTVINSKLGEPTRKEVTSLTSGLGEHLNTEKLSNSRRKSMVLEDSKHPIEDALYEMQRLQGSAKPNSKLGRVKDNGLVVTLPLITRSGESVIKYAKADYPLLDNGANEIANFEKNDYILITEIISDDWYRGEVYDNEKISPEHKEGLIPYNFIHILG